MIETEEFGEIDVRDAHIHFFSSRFFKTLIRLRNDSQDDPLGKAGDLTGWQMPPEDPSDLASLWAAELDRHGIGGAALIASVPGDGESVAAAVRDFPSKFAGAFMVDASRADAGVETNRTFSELGLKIACMFPAMFGFSMAESPGVREIAESASQHPGTALFVHCGALAVGARKKLGLQSRFDMRLSNPLDIYRLASEFPAVPFIIPHFGGGMLREALMVADLCPNVYLDTSSSNKWTNYYAPALKLPEVFASALKVAGPERLLFGTDSSYFPRGWVGAVFESQLAALKSCGVDAETAKQVFGGNLRRILNW